MQLTHPFKITFPFIFHPVAPLPSKLYDLSCFSLETLMDSFKVMGTIASQLKALSQNTPQSSIIL